MMPKTFNIKPILRQLSDITEDDLKDIFKKLSLLDLSECEFVFGKSEIQIWCNAEKSGKVIDCISYDFNVFKMMNNNGELNLINPQSDAFEILLSKHFDLFGLIESGLAIDKSTLKTQNY